MARSRHTILGGTAQFTAAVDVSFELTLAILAVANRLFRTSREVAMNHANAVKAFVCFGVSLLRGRVGHASAQTRDESAVTV